MIVNTAVFTCSICGETSSHICAYCTKDACSNHRCARCKRCSDCCECEVPLSADEPGAEEPVAAPVEPVHVESAAAASPFATTGFSTTGFAGSDVFLSPEEASVFVQPFDSGEAIELAEAESPDEPGEPEEEASE
jgi:hypothetical protein